MKKEILVNINKKTLAPEWKIHTPNLLQEILCNNGTSILLRPLQLLGKRLSEIGDAAIRLDDPELNHLMCLLTIYDVADPDSPSYD